MSVFNVQRRASSGSKPKQLRKQGLLPMALVERSHETMLIQAPTDQLREAMRHADGLGRLDLKIDGESKARKVIVKHVEHDVLKHELVHVTLQEVNEDDQIKIEIPVVAIGHPLIMDTEELLLLAVTDHIKVRGRMSDLPEKIEVDVTNLEMNHHIEAKDLQLGEGIELLSSPDATIFSLRHKLTASQEAADLEGSAPEEAAPAGETEAEASA